MSHGRPLSLTDAQLRAVIEAARVHPIQWRQRYLSGICDHLLLFDEVGDESVQRAIEIVLRRVGGQAA